MPTRRSIQTEVRRAFPGGAAPPDTSVREDVQVPELGEEIEHLSGLPWEVLAHRIQSAAAAGDCSRYNSDLIFIPGGLLNYYLPAYLIGALEPEAGDLPDSIFDLFDPESPVHRTRLLTELTGPQLQAVLAVLRHLESLAAKTAKTNAQRTGIALKDLLEAAGPWIRRSERAIRRVTDEIQSRADASN